MLKGRSGNRTIFSAKKRKMTILEKICSKPKYQTPCQPKQLWECQTVNRRPRLRKCRRNTTTTARTAPTTRPTLPTTPVKMCVCMKPRPDSEMHENQNDMLPYEGEYKDRPPPILTQSVPCNTMYHGWRQAHVIAAKQRTIPI